MQTLGRSMRHSLPVRQPAVDPAVQKATEALNSPEARDIFSSHPSVPQASSSASSSSSSSTASVPPAAAAGAVLQPTKPVEDPLLHQFARLIMRDGKLLTAQKTLATCLQAIRASTHEDPLPLLKRAVERASPELRTVQQKLTATKRATLPLPITERRRSRTAITWIVDASYKKRHSEKVFGKRLANEVLQVLEGNSEAIRKKDELHKNAVLARWVLLLRLCVCLRC